MGAILQLGVQSSHRTRCRVLPPLDIANSSALRRYLGQFYASLPGEAAGPAPMIIL